VVSPAAFIAAKAGVAAPVSGAAATENERRVAVVAISDGGIPGNHLRRAIKQCGRRATGKMDRGTGGFFKWPAVIAFSAPIITDEFLNNKAVPS
jgi:hypothetical protein